MVIVKAIVIGGMGPDRVFLQTNLLEPTWPYKEKMHLRFDAAAGRGLAYVEANFPNVEVESRRVD